MKIGVLLLLLIMISGSCRNAWNQTNEQIFYNACLDDAKTWAASTEQAATYCNCVIPKIKEKYSDENEAMKQISLLALDEDLKACRDSTKKK